MLAHFIEHEDLSPEDIKSLRALLDRKAREVEDK
jgi:predicted transcriptional regulator